MGVVKEDTSAIDEVARERAWESVGGRQRFLKVSRRQVRVVEVGRKGRPLLFFHGIGGWAETWGEVVPTMARAGYHCFAVDLPGFGQSAPPIRARYFDPGRSYYVRWVAKLMDELKLKRATLIGHSLGGTVAMLTAASRPERVSRLVLMAPGGFGDPILYRLRMMALPFGEWLAPYVPDRLIRGFLRANAYDPKCLPEWLYEDALKYARAGGGAELARVMSQGLSRFRGPNGLGAQWRARIAASIRCPTLVLWGREDRTLPVSHAVDAAATLPGAVVEVIDHAGHLLMLEKPRLVQRALLAFLEATAPSHASRSATARAGTDFAMPPAL
jgi:pimeloyl-ACP methyl ester carboxylesterase